MHIIYVFRNQVFSFLPLLLPSCMLTPFLWQKKEVIGCDLCSLNLVHTNVCQWEVSFLPQVSPLPFFLGTLSPFKSTAFKQSYR